MLDRDDPLVILRRTAVPTRPVVFSRRASVTLSRLTVTIDAPSWPRRLRVGEMRDLVIVPHRRDPISPSNPRFTARVRVDQDEDHPNGFVLRVVQAVA